MQHTGSEPKPLCSSAMEATGEEMDQDVHSDEVRPAALSGAGRSSPDSAMGEPDYGLSFEQTAGLFQDELGENPNQAAAGVFDQQQVDVDHQGPGTRRFEATLLDGSEPPYDLGDWRKPIRYAGPETIHSGPGFGTWR